ncbi:kinesin-like protein KIN-14C isoform X3 [Elaeis guineensis]|uniref:kinesin-like protein KIN-14C isoform X3 n=1 Tax=Elaeis guineensis var. tenera TaxID=51953 RepID=UPI003C6D2A3D
MPPGEDNANLDADMAKKRSEVIEWLNGLFPDFSMAPDASEEELRAALFDGAVFCAIIRRLSPGSAEEVKSGGCSPSRRRLGNIKKFISVVEHMGLPTFKVSDLEQGRISAVVVCLLCLRDHFKSDLGEDRDTNAPAKWVIEAKKKLEAIDVLQGDSTLSGQQSPVLGEERRPSLMEAKLQRVLRSPVMSEPSSAVAHNAGHKFHEVFQLKQGRYSDLPPAKISEMMKSNSLDNAPTQSLLSVVNGILDESIERKNGEIPQRVACLLRKVVQEIERRISTQAEHIRNQNNLIKAREEKYQSRIKLLETLATGTNEETQMEKSRTEERKKVSEEDVVRLMKEKEDSDNIVSKLKEDLKTTKRSYEQHCQQQETKAKQTQEELERRVKEVEFLLAESRKRTKELEAFSASKSQNWNQKAHVVHNFIGLQLLSVQELRMSSDSIKNEVTSTQKRWSEEFTTFAQKLKVLTDAVKNYHTVLAENRKLYNEVQELKGNIRVYCRIRPFLPGENRKSNTINYIGEDGELVLVNPSKPGKDGQKMFKFNKVYGPAASQEEVFLDTQPLIRSVLDGYNVCIFAYGQTGSGKTYTMTGPDSPTEEEWGVNYRALNDLFHISRTRRDTFMYEVGVQMVEIYNEQVRDLLSNDGSVKKLGIVNTSKPNGLAVPDASMRPVQSTSDVMNLMQTGLTNRAMSATALNERSSRSHRFLFMISYMKMNCQMISQCCLYVFCYSIVTVHVRGVDLKTGATLRGSLHLVDLAGSERVDRSEVTGDRLKEAQHINKSLSALGDVIFALSQKSPHVPYRNSKLTQVLQSSLGGHAKTLMFVQINPDAGSYSETLSTLKFAERVSGVELGAARSQKDGKDVKDLMEQVASLKDTIARKDEEIEQLQLLRDTTNQSPSVNSERQGGNTLKHSSSAPGISSRSGTVQQGWRSSGGKVVISNIKTASDPENYSDHSDKQSESGSHQSTDDLKHQREVSGQQKLAEGDPGQSSADLELLSFGDAESEERLSDISDSGLSMGTETDGSSSVIEFTLFPEQCKPAEVTKEKTTFKKKHGQPSDSISSQVCKTLAVEHVFLCDFLFLYQYNFVSDLHSIKACFCNNHNVLELTL